MRTNDTVNNQQDLRNGDILYTNSGIPINAFYTPEDIKEIDYRKAIGNPGEYPFTRGLYPAMYRKIPWATLEVSGFGLPEQTNAQQKYLIKQGQSHYLGRPAIHICFDLPTLYGYGSDHSVAQWDIGKSGVPVNSLADMEMLTKGLPLDQMHISFINCPSAAVVLAMYVACAEKRGIPREELSLSINNCSLIGPIADNMIVFPLKPTLKLMLDVVRICAEEMPKAHPITFQMYSSRERGATAVQELAFGFAAAIAVVEEGRRIGLEVDNFASKLVFFYSLDNYFFEEIAKLRAARRMWARIMRGRFGAKNPKSWQCQILSQTAGSTLTSKEPLNNIARVAIQALAGVLGGVQAMHTCSYDEALDIPTEETVRVAIKTQRIIEYETGVKDVSDPLGGSYFVEYLTDKIEEKTWKYLSKIEEMGGYIAAVEKGYIQNEVLESARTLQAKFEKGERVIVGLNKYVSEEESPVKTFNHDPKVREIILERLSRLKQERDNGKVRKVLEKVRTAAVNGEYLMPALIEVVKTYATMGEIMGILKEVFGIYEY